MKLTALHGQVSIVSIIGICVTQVIHAHFDVGSNGLVTRRSRDYHNIISK